MTMVSFQKVQANNCIRPPHFPPHCGCPAVAPAAQRVARISAGLNKRLESK